MSEQFPASSTFEPADRMDQFSESQIRVMFDLAEQHDGDPVRLEVGEPDFTTPEGIIDGAMGAAKDGATHYTSNAGEPKLRKLIAEKMAADNGIHVNPETEISVTNGAVEALLLSLLTVVNPGDDVLIPTPGWPNYSAQATIAGATPVEVPMLPEEGFDLNPERMIEAITEDTAAIILNTPCNPTGRVFDKDDIRDVVSAAADYDAYVIADEVYEGFVYDGPNDAIASYVEHPERVITINACSKKYAMTGWRLGWLVGREEVINCANTLHQSTTSCAPSISQQAAITALETNEGADDLYETFARRRDYVVERISEIPGISCPEPEGAIYAFINVSEFEGSSFDIAKRLLEEYEVVTTPGSGFGDVGEGYLRISFANSLERLREGFDRIEEMSQEER